MTPAEQLVALGIAAAIAMVGFAGAVLGFVVGLDLWDDYRERRAAAAVLDHWRSIVGTWRR